MRTGLKSRFCSGAAGEVLAVDLPLESYSGPDLPTDAPSVNMFAMNARFVAGGSSRNGAIHHNNRNRKARGRCRASC